MGFITILTSVPKKSDVWGKVCLPTDVTKIKFSFEEDRRINLDMKKIIALSTFLALSALGMACGGDTTANNAANKTAVNAMNSAANAANSAANAMANAANSMANSANSMANAANSMANKPANAPMANAANANKKP